MGGAPLPPLMVLLSAPALGGAVQQVFHFNVDSFWRRESTTTPMRKEESHPTQKKGWETAPRPQREEG